MFRESPCDSVAKERRSEYEEAKDNRAGSEGRSSRAHSIPHGNQHDIVPRARAVLKSEKVKKVKRGDRRVASLCI